MASRRDGQAIDRDTWVGWFGRQADELACNLALADNAPGEEAEVTCEQGDERACYWKELGYCDANCEGVY